MNQFLELELLSLAIGVGRELSLRNLRSPQLPPLVATISVGLTGNYTVEV